MRDRLLPGTVFAGYVIERVLGGGGMGTVYVARHPRLPRRDAVKVLSAEHSGDAEYRARFVREAELVARLNHPNIVAVHDRGVEDGRLWIAMQYVEGGDAAALVRGGAVPPLRAVAIVAQAARGLDDAHRAGLVHRDVKPGNLLLGAGDGRHDRVLVSDFGIGRSVGDPTVLTATGAVVATLAYAAPEQLMAHRVDHRADVYALGCTLYELLTGAKPFPRATAAAVLAAHLDDPPPRPTALRPELPPAIDTVIARALAKHPDARYQSCGALAADAAAAFGTARAPVPPPPPVPYSPAPVASRRRRGPLIAGALLLAVVAVVASVVVLQRNSTEGTPTAVSPSTTATSARPATTTAARNTWGSHTYMTDAFPGLLPSAPDAAGYQGMRCAALGAEGRPADVNVPATGQTRLNCNGDRNPLELLVVRCNADRHEVEQPTLQSGTTILGDETWQRLSGRGRLVWGDVPNPRGERSGTVLVTFDDPGRDYCQLLALGGASGADLRDRWWAGAPI
ncbi:serine/threonine-protein kinase [Nocardia blacklockiae]|uniref:serine/threonine-protein kinase n=1 Tax=Nocardia blacklockiae TaxID=480036 RepID=UPI0018945268|nr:serine/threonine-protein kinase [Nocardia blacklockiae]MBF6170498.1 serine/threonine protein kinase [Nocardia blacklockiae]